jgi:hypothetical protein
MRETLDSIDVFRAPPVSGIARMFQNGEFECCDRLWCYEGAATMIASGELDRFTVLWQDKDSRR